MQQRLKEQTEISLRETGALGKSGRSVAFRGIQRIRHDMLVAHTALFVLIRLFSDSTARDGNFERCDRVERLRERELYRTTHLPVCRAFHYVITSGKHTTKRAYIEKFAAQPFHG